MLWLALLVLATVCFGIGIGFAFLGNNTDNANVLVERINDCLPQTQCAQCNFPGCRPYAEAIAEGRANINQCPPGGEATIHALAELLAVQPIALDTTHGENKAPQVAVIDEAVCIGCTLCIPPCPVDAIVGSAKLMHTVIKEDCTGCELCIAPCPVDCISLVLAHPPITTWQYPPPTANS